MEKRITVAFYRTASGAQPVRDWLLDGRVIFCVSERQLLLLHGFIKKTAKTPRQDIDLALRRMQEGLS